MLLIGTAGWSIPKAVADAFPGPGSHLQRYASVMLAVEINSSFYRSHRRATYERWAASTPGDFRFSVKVPKEISHVRKLVDARAPLEGFLEEVSGLGTKLGVLLLQLPPSLAFEHSTASTFLDALGKALGTRTDIACEPRHATWFGADADLCLRDHRVARVAADPVLVPGGDLPGGWTGLQYLRLHGSPRVYYSAYDPQRLEALAQTMGREHEGRTTWCMFDNTASGAAMADALYLRSRLNAPEIIRA